MKLNGDIVWLWLALGLVMAITGGGFKAHEIYTTNGVLEFLLFRGWSYILMIAGTVLIILGLGHDLLFRGRGETVQPE